MTSEENIHTAENRNKLLHLEGVQLQEVAFNIPGEIKTGDPKGNNVVFCILLEKLSEHLERHFFNNFKPENGVNFNKIVLKL